MARNRLQAANLVTLLLMEKEKKEKKNGSAQRSSRFYIYTYIAKDRVMLHIPT